MICKTLMTRSLAIVLLGISLCAQSSTDVTQQPGYVDFGDLDAISGTEPEVVVSLTPMMLRFLAAAIAEEDEELADTLGKLISIQISVFELQPKDVKDATARAIRISKQLESDDWDPAVIITSDDTLVRMYMKTVNEVVAGMTVMVVELDGGAVFINIIGEIDPAQLGRVTNKFGVSLEDLAKGN